MNLPRHKMKPLSFTLFGIAAFLLVLFVMDSTIGLTSAACLSCHAEDGALPTGGAHESVACLSCHLDNGAWSIPGFKVSQWSGMYPAQLFGSEAGPVRSVSRSACVSCHDTIGDGVVERSGLRIDHRSCAASPANCGECHGGIAHGETVRWGRQPVMEECVVCHERAGAPRECDDCHAGRLQIERLNQGPWRVTHGPEWQTTHAMGTYENCLVCHDSGYCGKCHGVAVPHSAAFGGMHGTLAQDSDARCDTCHTVTTFCDACHGVEMPHPAGYLQTHASDAETDEDPRCVTCHQQDSCVQCHVRHVHPGGAASGTDQGEAGR